MLCDRIFNGVLIQSVPYGRHWLTGMVSGLRAEDQKACEDEVARIVAESV